MVLFRVVGLAPLFQGARYTWLAAGERRGALRLAVDVQPECQCETVDLQPECQCETVDARPE